MESCKANIKRADDMILKKPKPNINIAGIVASMNFEDMEVSKESLCYAEQRANNQTSYEERITTLKQKYTKKSNKNNE